MKKLYIIRLYIFLPYEYMKRNFIFGENIYQAYKHRSTNRTLWFIFILLKLKFENYIEIFSVCACTNTPRFVASSLACLHRFHFVPRMRWGCHEVKFSFRPTVEKKKKKKQYSLRGRQWNLVFLRIVFLRLASDTRANHPIRKSLPVTYRWLLIQSCDVRTTSSSVSRRYDKTTLHRSPPSVLTLLTINTYY